MLKKLKDGESWSIEEMAKEQLYFQANDGKPIAIVHHGTNEPYYARELAEAIYLAKTITLEHDYHELETRTGNLISELSKWAEQQGVGKRINQKLLEKKNDIHEWYKTGISKREIARRLKVSEGTIRHFLKKYPLQEV